MPQTLMGVVRYQATPTIIVARILPLDDVELDNPAWRRFVIPGNPVLELVKVARPAIPRQTYTRVFLYTVSSASCQFPDPGNWNPAVNRVEVVGSGQSGWRGVNEPVGASGGGGGGGAYGRGINIPATFPVPYTIFPGDTVTTTGTVCVWGNTSTTAGVAIQLPNVVYAGVAAGGQNNSPGSGGQNYWPTGFVGGPGGQGQGSTASTNIPGGGGGGAGGPNGSGGSGGQYTGPEQPPGYWNNGGNADANTVLGGSSASANGASGTEWGIYGVGAGGASSNAYTVAAGAGGAYGGGGGGGAMPPAGQNGLSGRGGDGLIVVTYTPLPPGMQAQTMG